MGEGTTKLPPGFHFFPSDQELIAHFLHRKAAHLPCQPDIIPTFDFHYCDPWDLDGKALQGGKYWYFFTQRSQNWETTNGYWKPIGVEESITRGDADVGLKKTLLFYLGESPEGMETNWIMHEYHLLDGDLSDASSSGGSRRSFKKRSSTRMVESNKWVICRVFESSCGSQSQSFHDEGIELSCLDEVFLSLDDLDEVSLPN